MQVYVVVSCPRGQMSEQGVKLCGVFTFLRGASEYAKYNIPVDEEPFIFTTELNQGKKNSISAEIAQKCARRFWKPQNLTMPLEEMRKAMM